MKALILLIALLTGCATCEHHPIFCSAAAMIVAGSIVAASQNHGGHAIPHCHQQPTPLDCRPVMGP